MKLFRPVPIRILIIPVIEPDFFISKVFLDILNPSSLMISCFIISVLFLSQTLESKNPFFWSLIIPVSLSSESTRLHKPCSLCLLRGRFGGLQFILSESFMLFRFSDPLKFSQYFPFLNLFLSVLSAELLSL